MTQITILQDWHIRDFCKSRGLDLEALWCDECDVFTGKDELLATLPIIQTAITSLFNNYAISFDPQNKTSISRISSFLKETTLLNSEVALYDINGNIVAQQSCSLQPSNIKKIVADSFESTTPKTEPKLILEKIGTMLASYFEASALRTRFEKGDEHCFSLPRIPLVFGMHEDQVVTVSFPTLNQSSFEPFTISYQLEQPDEPTSPSLYTKAWYLFLAANAVLTTIIVPGGNQKEEAEDPYAIVGISQSATKAEISKKCRQLLKENHPDKGGDQQRFMKLSAACEKLKNNALDDKNNHPEMPLKISLLDN